MSADGYTSWYAEAARTPRGVKAWLRGIARHTLLSALGTVTRTGSRGPFLRLVYCHYVFDDQVAEFEKILRALQQVGRFVDTDTCVSLVRGSRPLDGQYLHLSFDDGFKNIYTNARPVLERLGIPAIVFVPTALVGASLEAARQYAARQRSTNVMEMMTWDDLRRLRASRIEVGSHTRNHVRFTDIVSNGTAEDELLGSKQDIERELGLACSYIAWPYGKRSDADDASIAAVKRAGYAACFGAFRGSVEPGSVVDPFRIPRHHFEPEWPLSHVRYFVSGHGEG